MFHNFKIKIAVLNAHTDIDHKTKISTKLSADVHIEHHHDNKMSIYRSTITKVDEDKVCCFYLYAITSIKQSPVLKGHLFLRKFHMN